MCEIVIADADELLTDQLVSALSGVRGLEVVGTARDYGSALAVIGRTRPDVVLVGSALPLMGGIALVECIKSVLPDVKVVLIARDEHSRTVQRARSAGADGLLVVEGGSSDSVASLRWLIPGED